MVAGVRLGCYGPVKTLLGDTKENKSIVRNIAAGSLSGSLAAWASNPIDLIKTRLQSKENPHRTSTAVIRSIVKTDGIRGLWKGTVPSTVSLLQQYILPQGGHSAALCRANLSFTMTLARADLLALLALVIPP